MIQFTILAGTFFSLCGHGGDRRSQQALRTLAGRSPAQKPHGREKTGKGEGVKGRRGVRRRGYNVRTVGEVVLLFSLTLSRFLTFHLFFLLALALQLQPDQTST